MLNTPVAALILFISIICILLKILLPLQWLYQWSLKRLYFKCFIIIKKDIVNMFLPVLFFCIFRSLFIISCPSVFFYCYAKPLFSSMTNQAEKEMLLLKDSFTYSSLTSIINLLCSVLHEHLDVVFWLSLHWLLWSNIIKWKLIWRFVHSLSHIPSMPLSAEERLIFFFKMDIWKLAVSIKSVGT